MHSVIPMHIAKIGHIVLSALLSVLGIILVVLRRLTIPQLPMICGILLIAFGAIKIVGYLSKDIYRLAFQFDLTFGVILAVLGLVFTVRPETLTYICVFFGMVIAADGIIKVRIALQAKAFGIEAWWLIFALAVLAVVGGAIVAVRPSDDTVILTTLLGASFIVEGIMGICTMITSVKIVEYKDTGDR